MAYVQFRVFCFGIVMAIGALAACNQFLGMNWSSADKICMGLLLGATSVIFTPIALTRKAAIESQARE